MVIDEKALDAAMAYWEEEQYIHFDRQRLGECIAVYEAANSQQPVGTSAELDAVALALTQIALLCRGSSKKEVAIYHLADDAIAKLGLARKSPEREISSPPLEMGMKMKDVRVGMRMKSLYGGPVITVTELTEKGFKYSHPPYHLGARIGQTIGGEHYGYNGYSHYTEVGSEPA
jgi:hypothetical protein